jgi:hypothetical protein
MRDKQRIGDGQALCANYPQKDTFLCGFACLSGPQIQD